MRRRGDLARAALAGVFLAIVVVGVPVVLVGAVGWPLPRGGVRLDEVVDALTVRQALPATTVWKILAVVVWVAWAQVVASVLIEVATVARGGLVRPLPGLGLAQGLAAPLVAALALAWPAGPAHAAPASPPAATAPPAPGPAPPPQRTAEPAPADQATVDHVVVRRDTLWGLAQRYLGDGHRAGELFELNRGRPQPDGQSLSDPGLLRPGWVLAIPVPAAPTAGPDQVVVHAGDTLWSLAGEHLGEPERYTELVDLNAGRPQPDGQALVDPDRIEPGWVLRLPPTSTLAQASTPPAIEDPAPPAPGAPSPLSTGSTSPPVTAPHVPPDSPPATDPEIPTTADAGDLSIAPTNTPPQTTAPEPAEHDEGVPGPMAPVGLIGGGLATAGIVALLDRRRRAQQRLRRRGRRLPTPATEVVTAERELRAGADIDTATLVDVALRAAVAGAGPDGLAPLRWVEAGAGTATLVLDTTVSAPDGFVDDGPGRWRCASDQAHLAALGATAASPAPCLVPVGRDEAGLEVLVDLEAAGVLSLVGPTAVTGPLLNTVALALASAPWADQPRILAVGLDLSGLDQVMIEEVATLDDALDQAERRAQRVADALRATDCTSAAQARGRGITPDAWQALVVLAAVEPDEAQGGRLAAVAARAGHGVAVVVAVAASEGSTGATLVADADGTVAVEGMAGEVQAHQITPPDLDLVGEMLDNAAQPDVAPPPPSPAPRAARGGGPRGDNALADLLDGVDVLVHVLGPIEATRRTAVGEEALHISRQKVLEAIVYLALRDAPADREELQAALWPAGTNSPKTFQNTIWEARRLLGVDRDGVELLPEPRDARYGLNHRLVTEYGLFHELVTRADELDDAGHAADLLAQALTLVRGEPFVGVGRNYAWVAEHSGIIVAQVVDAAEELAEVRLATGDWRKAEWAARQGLRAFPCDERLYRLLMRCAHGAGSLASVQRTFNELLAKTADPDGGVEPIDTVHADTIVLLEELTAAKARNARVIA